MRDVKQKYIINRGRYGEVYIKTGSDEGLTEYLSEVILAPNMFLFEVKATYATSLRPVSYYAVASSMREARAIFRRRFPWLDIITSVGLPCSDRANEVLKNPGRFIII